MNSENGSLVKRSQFLLGEKIPYFKVSDSISRAHTNVVHKPTAVIIVARSRFSDFAD